MRTIIEMGRNLDLKVMAEDFLQLLLAQARGDSSFERMFAES